MVYEMTPNKIFTHRWLPVDGCIEFTGGVPEKVKNLPGLLALNDNGKAADRLFFDLGKFSCKILVTNFVKFKGNRYWFIIKKMPLLKPHSLKNLEGMPNMTKNCCYYYPKDDIF